MFMCTKQATFPNASLQNLLIYSSCVYIKIEVLPNIKSIKFFPKFGGNASNEALTENFIITPYVLE